jgi:ADP-heptose:LPS heptosyltransferase
VAINPVTRFPERQWTFDGFAAIGDRLSSIGFQIILLYGPGEREKAEQVARRMQHPSLIDYPMPNILELRCILSHCKLYVGNDGGPKHLAIAAGVPTVTLFGNSPDPWTPWADPLHRVIASAKSGHSIRSSGELIADAPSIDAISTESVWRQIEISISKIRQAG